MFALLLILVPAGCATEHLQTERALAAAGFSQYRGPQVDPAISMYRPYVFTLDKGTDKKERIVFASPARRTLFVGDKAAARRFDAIQQQQAQYAAAKSDQNRMRWAQFGQILAQSGAQFGADMQQQAAVRQQNIIQQQNFLMQQQSIRQQEAMLRTMQQPQYVYPTIPGTTIRDYSHFGPVGVIQ